MFHYFTLEEVYKYAEKLGYSKEQVEIKKVCTGYDYELEQEIEWEYEVSFGHEWTEAWVWSFESLDEPAVDYEHYIVED